MPYLVITKRPCPKCEGSGDMRNPCAHPDDALDGPYVACDACDGTTGAEDLDDAVRKYAAAVEAKRQSGEAA